MRVFLGPYPEEGEREIEVEVHNYDSWSADHTLSLIIVPVLQELRRSLHGAPCLFPNEVPEDLQSYVEDEDWDTSSEYEMNIFRTWENILDEMIWAFSEIQIDDDSWHSDVEAYKKYEERRQRGCELFGKFYTNLWD